MNFIHKDFIKERLSNPIIREGIIKVGNNLNDYINFKEADDYATNYKRQYSEEGNVRQEKGSKDAILGKLVEEIIIYLIHKYSKLNKLNLYATNEKNDKHIKMFSEKLILKKRNTNLQKYFDCDIFIINKNNYKNTKRVYILSAKGTTRERIGQFLSHLFMMDQRVINVKYGKDKYDVIFETEGISIKYGFVTLDWAKNKDFIKYTKGGGIRNTVKQTEIVLVNDDYYLGGGVFVLNNNDNLDGTGNFGSLVGRISDFLI